MREHVTDLVHEPTQVHDGVVDLTVAEVSEVTAPGRIDFGGGELEPAETTPHPSATRHADDDYEWWTLDAGQYLLEYNESLPGTGQVTIQPRDAVLARGASHPTVTVSQLPQMPLAVGGAGLELKENARVSTVLDRSG